MGKLRHAIAAHKYQLELEPNLAPDALAVDHFRLALEGKDGAGGDLVAAAPRDLRGIVAVWLYHRFRAGEAPQACFRDALEDAWSLNYALVRSAVGNRRALRSMFEAAGFPPSQLNPDDVIDIWRGTGGISLQKARLGVSWSTHRDAACWFATVFCKTPKYKPLVIKTTVRARDVIWLDYGAMGEDEVIYFDGHAAEIDGNKGDWLSRGRAWEAAKQARERKR